ncbi:MAG: hypothetical protein AAF549_08860 [Pseudomonadota bacterium]
MKYFILLFILFLPLATQAQDSQIFIAPGTNVTNEALEIIEANRKAAMEDNNEIVPDEVLLSTVRYDYMSDNQFGILMRIPDTTTGCFTVSPLQYEAKFVDNNYLDIKVDSYRVAPIETQNVAYDCNQSYKAASSVVVVNLDDIQRRNIKEIRFSNGGVRDTYFIKRGPNRVMLEADTQIVFKPDENSSLMVNFGGESVVALQVPMALSSDDLSKAVNDFAMRYSLSPVENLRSLNKQPSNKVFYFNDANGRLSGLIEEKGYAPLGEIPAVRAYSGPQGIEDRSVPLKIFVTRHDIVL